MERIGTAQPGGSDIKGVNNFDILSEQKQKELTQLIAKIKQFKPTKIAVEMMLTDQQKLGFSCV